MAQEEDQNGAPFWARFYQEGHRFGCVNWKHSLNDRGQARLIECANPALATLIASDHRTRKFCMLAGDR
ncbi:MAG: hypothetical protein AB1489_09400, partial [Acidobacteriota bacterium]